MKRVTVCREGHVSPEDVIFCPQCGDADDIRFEFVHDDWCQIHGQFGPPVSHLPEPGEVFVEHLPRVCTCAR